MVRNYHRFRNINIHRWPLYVISPGLLHRVQIQKNISSLRILMFWVTERRTRTGHDNVSACWELRRRHCCLHHSLIGVNKSHSVPEIIAFLVTKVSIVMQESCHTIYVLSKTINTSRLPTLWCNSKQYVQRLF